MPLFRLERVFKALTNAEFKALPTTPITVIAAPGSGYRIKLLGLTVRTNTASGAYTNINATYVALMFSLTNAAGTWVATGLVDDTTTTPDMAGFAVIFGATRAALVDVQVPYVGSLEGDQWLATPEVSSNTASHDNAPIVVSIDNNGSGALTGGHANNTMTIVATYLVEPTT